MNEYLGRLIQKIISKQYGSGYRFSCPRCGEHHIMFYRGQPWSTECHCKLMWHWKDGKPFADEDKSVQIKFWERMRQITEEVAEMIRRK